MRQLGEGMFRQQVKHLQHQFLQDGNLPFSGILSTDLIKQALTALEVSWVDCVYTPLVTLCVFLGQVLSVDHSCRAAVARLIAYRVARKSVRALRKAAPTAKPANVCRRSSSRSLRSKWGSNSIQTQNRIGLWKNRQANMDVYTCGLGRISFHQSKP